jgi:ankyrin repeat protein
MRDELGIIYVHDVTRHVDTTVLAQQLEHNPRYCISTDCWGATPLHWAARYGNKEAIAVLLAAGADLNAVCKRGRTVLSWAVQSRSVDCCRTILTAATDISIDTSRRPAPVSGASNLSTTNGIVTLPRCLSIDLEGKDNNGETALSLVVRTWGCLAICRLLLNYGANIDGRNRAGETALLLAVQYNRHTMLQLLLDKGASRTIITYDGSSILHEAAYRADVYTMKILQEACLDGLLMDSCAVTSYWKSFACRDETCRIASRTSQQEETAAFQALLDSIVP